MTIPQALVRLPLLLIAFTGLVDVSILPLAHGSDSTDTESTRFDGKVVGVTDGDTIQVLHDGKTLKVRLNGVDAPERGQAFGQKAKKFVSDACFGKNVTVVKHGEDKYGRTIGDIYLSDDTHLNRALVDNGLAWWYRKYAPDDTALAKVEEAARTARRGLWADTEPIAPWDWRHRERPPSDNPQPRAGPPPAALGLLQQPAAQNAAVVPPKEGQATHWLTTSSGKRHNQGCRYYKASNGRACGPKEGTACKICGG